MQRFIPVLCAGLVALAAPFAHAETTAPLTPDAALYKALAYSPALKAQRENILGTHGERLQSGLALNPEFSLEAENILGNGSANGVKGAEITLGIAQTLEMGGKRGARISAAERQTDIAAVEYAAGALDLLQAAANTWTEAAAAEEELRLAQSQEKLARDVLGNVSKRVAAAAESAIQKSKADVALAAARAAAAKAERKQAAATAALAARLGEETLPALDTAAFFAAAAPDSQSETIAQNPDVSLIEAGIAFARANLALERANAVPDITLEAGVRDSRDADEQSFLAGVSIPFPAFNRNQGSIRKAGHDIAKAEHEKSAMLDALNAALQLAQSERDAAHAEIAILEGDILPAAEKAFAQARSGYQSGKFAYLEVLDAQRTLFDVKTQRIAAFRDYHLATAAVDRLTGRHMNLIPVSAAEKK